MSSSWFNIDSFKDLTAKVQEALPIDKEMLEKLTLTTPELTAERQRIDQEERFKEEIKDMLTDMLPWETRDPDRDILVEECKEAIMQLSSDPTTFFGPYTMPGSNNNEQEEEEMDHSARDKLAKLEPLPILLRDFDLNAHVGLINRLLTQDPKLVQMQSQLSGGGERELIFWKNYFFHCAFTRYEAGLSIDEIWSDQSLLEKKAQKQQQEHTAEEVLQDEQQQQEEETITFDDKNEPEVEKAFASDPTTDSDAPFQQSKDSSSSSTPSENASEFEIVANESADDAQDYELDELEAEIARELED